MHSVWAPVQRSVKPVKLASDVLCRNDANLITADAAITFLIDTLTKESNKNNTHAQVIRDFVVKRIHQRRNHVLVLLKKYLVKGDLPHTDLITGTKVNKSNLHAKSNASLQRFLGMLLLLAVGTMTWFSRRRRNSCPCLNMAGNITNPIYDRVVAESTQQKDNQTTQRVPLTQDLNYLRLPKKDQNGLKNCFRPCWQQNQHQSSLNVHFLLEVVSAQRYGQEWMTTLFLRWCHSSNISKTESRSSHSLFFLMYIICLLLVIKTLLLN